MSTLPIESVLANIKISLAEHRGIVLVAEPGAGKTTRVPLALIDEPWLEGKRVVMLEPRRLAARSTAHYMSAILGEPVGKTVGYRMRGETRISNRTRIEVITEGVLTRMLQSDPGLEGVGLLIFDEFHERNLHSDIGLALALECQSILRNDLRILVMSATIDAEPIAALLGDAPVIRSKGRSYPVITQYIEQRLGIDNFRTIEACLVQTIRSAIHDREGDVLVFLPGAREIHSVAERLRTPANADIRVCKLYGGLTQAEQALAIMQDPEGRRKVVLSTSIAETSLTVEGVRIVIDCGLSRVSRYSPRTGMSRLETIRVSLSSADQRRGRAGRLGPGICYRLWTAEEERHFTSSGIPEIREADLTSLALEIAQWGVQDPSDLKWLDSPPIGAYGQAVDLLQELGALDRLGQITAHGREMAELGLHPRLAHMVIRGIMLQLGDLACDLAVLLGERDVLLRTSEPISSDIRLRIEAIRKDRGGDYSHAIDHAISERVRRESRQLMGTLGIADRRTSIDACGILLALAYPDRIAQRRDNGKYLLSNGRGAVLPSADPLSRSAYLVAAELDDRGTEGKILLAAPILLSDIKESMNDYIQVDRIVYWDTAAQAVRGRKQETIGRLVLQESVLHRMNSEEVLDAMLEGIRQEGLDILPWGKLSVQFVERLRFMSKISKEWPDFSQEALLHTIDAWLGPYLTGMKSREEWKRLNLQQILAAMLSWGQQQELDNEAPTHIQVPSGSRIPVHYDDPAAPYIAVRLQEVFGMMESPRIAYGRVSIILHLLSPAQRPIQVTSDLASFWKKSYFEVKKDLKGRYPKHYWPDDPLQAVATNRLRPRK